MMTTSMMPKGVEQNRSRVAAIVLALAMVGTVRPARAQFYDGFGGPSPNIEGITVAGKGHVTARPNLVEVDVDISASSELTADAIVKYRDAKKRLRDAFSGLKLANVAVDERGLSVEQKGMNQSPYYFFDYSPNPKAKTEVQLSRKLVVKANDIRKMDEEAVLQLVAKLLDVAQDAGAHVGPKNNDSYYYYRWGNPMPGLVRFVVEDLDKVQEQAYEKAIADARSRAERLARLSRLELGPVLAVRETVVPGEGASNPNPYYYGGGSNSDDEEPRKRLETSKYQEIPVRVELVVRFAVHPKGDGKARAGEQGK